MKEHPILFSSEMVKAILEGRKTQTRRVIKPQPTDDATWAKHGSKHSATFYRDIPVMLACLATESPYGQIGDVLWVRETWQAQEGGGKWWHEVKEHRELYNWCWTNPVMPSFDATPPRWLPGRFMPRAACRLRLEIVNIRAERVRNITPMECIKEGIARSIADAVFIRADEEKEKFHTLWDSINAKRGYGWDTNPYVWVIEFRPIE